MTREEAIRTLRKIKGEVIRGSYIDEVYDMAIEALQTPPISQRSMYQAGYRQGREEALKGEQLDEWCTDCKEYDTEKKRCPRFNKVIREALKREPSDDGTLEVKVEDATKIGRVLISDDKHRGGLYYPDEDEPQGISFENDTKIKSCSKDSDLISRADAIEAMGEEPPVWCDEEYEIAERDQWRADIEAIKSVPSAGRPRGEWIETAQDYYETVNKKGGGVNENTEYFTDDIACPNCLAKFSNIDNETERFNFCPNCGADMRETKGAK